MARDTTVIDALGRAAMASGTAGRQPASGSGMSSEKGDGKRVALHADAAPSGSRLCIRSESEGAGGDWQPIHSELGSAHTETGSDWLRIHSELVRIAGERRRIDLDEGRWLLAAQRARVHAELGYGSLVEYVERLFGYSPKWTREKLRVAGALAALPEIAAAVAEGRLTWSAARELSRTATAQTESEWLAAASGQSVRQIERLVRGHAAGSRPGEPPDPAAERHVVRFELGAEVYATLREALGKLQREAGGTLDQEGAILQMARQVLSGPGDAGRASYQVAVTVCSECGRGEQTAHGQRVELPRSVVEMTECDAQHIGRVDTVAAALGPDHAQHIGRVDTVAAALGPDHAQHKGSVDTVHAPPVSSDIGRVDTVHAPPVSSHIGRVDTVHAPPVSSDIGRVDTVHAPPVSSDIGRVDSSQLASPVAHDAPIDTAHVGRNPKTLGSRAHVGRQVSVANTLPERATQTIPPATRRLVMHRDHATCQVPGCHNATFCDVHHITRLADGGAHHPDQLLVLCSAHHRAVHAGALVIEGSASTGLSFRHADGTSYGAPPNAGIAAIHARVFRALRSMGFGEREARRALAELPRQPPKLAHAGPASVEAVLREALERLTPPTLAQSA